MTDEQHARAVAGWIARAATTIRELAAQHADLAGHVAAGSGSGSSDGVGIRGTKVEPDLPIRPEVVDLRAAIEKDAGRYAALVRGTLRGTVAVPPGTAGRLGLIADNLAAVNDADDALASEVIEAMWDHHRSASRVVEPPRGLRPFRIEDPCPLCGFASLWVDPKGWRIGCGMPGCRHVWGVADPVLASTAQEGTR
jgi:hypothetical protein